MAACPRCRHPAAAGDRFCSRCGARVGVHAATAEVRKTVTVLFSDLADSTRLGESLDPEPVRVILARWFDAGRAGSLKY